MTLHPSALRRSHPTPRRLHRSTSRLVPPLCASCLVLSLLACHGGHEESATSATSTSTSGEMSAGDTTAGDTTTGDSQTCNELPCRPVVMISSGEAHACALLSGGTIRCWGLGQYGQLGLGDVDAIGDDESPSSVAPVSLGSPATYIAANDGRSCAVLLGGGLRCWGGGNYGALGIGSTENVGDDETPDAVPLMDLGFHSVAVTIGNHHVCALSDEGTVRCWGSDANGRLGHGVASMTDCFNPDPDSAPYDCTMNIQCCIGDDEPPSAAPVVALGGPAVQLAAGGAHTCALLEDGGVLCWGVGDLGQLGYGNTESVGDDELPVSAGLVDLGMAARQIAAGARHSCALLVDGSIRCWGDASFGALGYGSLDRIGDDEVPLAVPPVPVGAPALALSAGGSRTCAILEGGEVRCWGNGRFGALGLGDAEDLGDDESPDERPVVPLGSPALQIEPGHVTCALLDDRLVRCWGFGATGALGNGILAECLEELDCGGSPQCCVGDDPREMPPPPIVLL